MSKITKKLGILFIFLMLMGFCCVFTIIVAIYAADVSIIFDENLVSKSDFEKNTLVFAEQIELNHDVEKSALLITEELEVNENIDSHLVALVEQEVVINGEVKKNAFVVTSDLEINGKIGDDLMIDVEDLKISNAASISGNIEGQADVVEIDGTVDGKVFIEEADYVKITGAVGGDVKIIAEKVELEGTFDKDVEIKADELYVSDEMVADSLIYDVDDEFENNSTQIGRVEEDNINPGSKKIEKFDKTEKFDKFNVFAGGKHFANMLFEALFVVVVAVLGFVFFRERVQKFSKMVVENPLMFLKLGVIHLVLMIIGMIGFTVTIVFIPFTLIIALILFLQYLATIPVAAYIGYAWLDKKYELKTDFQRIGIVGSITAVIYLSTKIPIFGWLIYLVLFLLTIGISTRVFSKIRAD